MWIKTLPTTHPRTHLGASGCLWLPCLYLWTLLKMSGMDPGPSLAPFGILRDILRVYFWVYFRIMDGMSEWPLAGWLNINKYQQISTSINKYEQISTNINKYEQISTNNKYEQISKNINKYQHISTNTNKYQQ